MTAHKIVFAIVAPAALCLLAGCGDGGGGIASTPVAPPPPPPPPPPAPPPPPPPPLAPSKIGLESAEPFAVYGAGFAETPDPTPSTGKSDQAISFDKAVNITYREADKSYLVTLPDVPTGRFEVRGYNGTSGQIASSTYGKLVDADGNENGYAINLFTPGQSQSPWTYSSLAYWFSDQASAVKPARGYGYIAYGLPTAASDIPLSGTATYAADVKGLGPDDAYVFGTATLQFDFGAGALQGVMKPLISWGWDNGTPLGDYTFRDTVFARGSTKYSGAFDITGASGPQGRFEGLFTGPQAAETIARWQAPYAFSNGSGSIITGTMNGIWIGKKN